MGATQTTQFNLVNDQLKIVLFPTIYVSHASFVFPQNQIENNLYHYTQELGKMYRLEFKMDEQNNYHLEFVKNEDDKVRKIDFYYNIIFIAFIMKMYVYKDQDLKVFH